VRRGGGRELGLVGIAAGLGLLGDLLLRTVPLGLNAALVTAALAVALLAIRRSSRGASDWSVWAYAAAALVIGIGFCWRDSPVLKWLDGLAVLGTLALLASGSREEPSLSGVLWRSGRTSAHLLLGPIPILGEVPWTDVRSPVSSRVVFGTARGLVLALPIVLVFATLLAQADAVFAIRLRELFDLDIPGLFAHACGTVAMGWLAAGWLSAAESSADGLLPRRPAWLALGSIETGLVLGLLDVLFAGFVWVQLRYLFGGAAWVDGTAGLTYSQYARRGFFELVAVTALVLPLLLAAHWLLGHARVAVRRVVLGLAAIQVALVLVMLASALERMRVYRVEYGQTELRFYSTAFMLWLGVLLVAFLLTVLPGSRAAFARVAIGSAFVALVLLHVVNPDERIVVANREAPRGFDLEYALGLSADAVPALLETAPSLPLQQQNALATRLFGRWLGPEDDLRRWSLSRGRARQLVQAHWIAS
jgi:hypothetical protein